MLVKNIRFSPLFPLICTIFARIETNTSAMKRENIFKGLGVAVATPFTTDGAVDYPALHSIIDYQIGYGADFLCVLGTTAETPCLDAAEKEEITRQVTAWVHGRVPILLGCGGNNTASVVRFLQTADLTGVDGVLIVCPFYNKPSQEGLYQHFCHVAAASPLPVVLYNVPGRTGVNLDAATTLRIAHDCPNVVAIKEASGKIGQIEDILKDAPEGFDVLSGDDAITLELISAGAAGVISVIGNAYPAEFGEMVHSALAGDFNTALRWHRRFNELYKLMSVDGNPAGVKALLAVLERAGNRLRLPLVPVRQETMERIRRFVSDF